jgi:hypothetical protein
MNKNMVRFYSVMECFLDDDRIAAHAIVCFRDSIVTAEDVYRDLLACKFYLWVGELESITEAQECRALKEWCLQKQFELDMMRDALWNQGDERTIEKEAWKI